VIEFNEDGGGDDEDDFINHSRPGGKKLMVFKHLAA